MNWTSNGGTTSSKDTCTKCGKDYCGVWSVWNECWSLALRVGTMRSRIFGNFVRTAQALFHFLLVLKSNCLKRLVDFSFGALLRLFLSILDRVCPAGKEVYHLYLTCIWRTAGSILSTPILFYLFKIYYLYQGFSWINV